MGSPRVEGKMLEVLEAQGSQSSQGRVKDRRKLHRERALGTCKGSLSHVQILERSMQSCKETTQG